jgi:hypothetical protein
MANRKLDPKLSPRDAPLPHVAAQTVDVDRVRAIDGSRVTADVRVSIRLDNGATYTAYRRIRLGRDKHAAE